MESYLRGSRRTERTYLLSKPKRLINIAPLTAFQKLTKNYDIVDSSGKSIQRDRDERKRRKEKEEKEAKEKEKEEKEKKEKGQKSS